MSNLILESPNCFRCHKNPIEYICHDCPKECNRFCSVCDTAVHSSKLAIRLLHKRKKFLLNFSPSDNLNQQKSQFVQNMPLIMEEEKGKNFQEKEKMSNIDKMHKNINLFKNNLIPQQVENEPLRERIKNHYESNLLRDQYIEKLKKENKEIVDENNKIT